MNNDNKHKIKKIKECEEMIQTQKALAIYNSIFCGMWSLFCAFDASAFLHDKNLFLLLLSIICGKYGARHYLYTLDGIDIIRENKEEIKRLKK